MMNIYPTLAKNIIYGDLAQVQAYLASGNENIHDLDEYGFTPLIEAVIFDKLDIIQFLIASQVDVNDSSITGHTALYWAVEKASLEICEILLKSGADPNAYSRSSQPILVFPLLRHQEKLKQLLYQYGADLAFAQDFIATKLLGHRFELMGPVDIADTSDKFITLDLEGFFLEFSVDLIQYSFSHFKTHFLARNLKPYFSAMEKIIQALTAAASLIKYQHFALDQRKYYAQIDKLLTQSLKIIPLAYTGHAICFVQYADYLVKCDRGAEGRKHGSVIVYEMQKPAAFDNVYIKNLLYTKQNEESIVHDLPARLDLKIRCYLPIPPQITGNCSWANIEAAIPAALFLLLLQRDDFSKQDRLLKKKELALSIYDAWHAWDKETHLHQFIQKTKQLTGPRKVSRAMTLATLLCQALRYDRQEDLKIAGTILSILTEDALKYILENYIEVLYGKEASPLGNNLVHLLDITGYRLAL